ncbi:hypothetical protein LguiA_022447 [Lonicera macranthoides]
MDGGGSSGGGGGGGGGGGSEGEKKKPPEGEVKVKRKMKTAKQLEVLEKTYAALSAIGFHCFWLELSLDLVSVETYPSDALRSELSVQLGLSDRQLQMWFCHRRLKDRKAPPVKRPRKDVSPAAVMGSSGGIGDEMVAGEVGNEHVSGSGSGSSPFGHAGDSQRRLVVPRVGGSGSAAVARIGGDMPAMKRYYEPPQAISELRAIAFVEAQLGEPLREDGPILGMEFDPLPPGAFGAPIGPMSVIQFVEGEREGGKWIDRVVFMAFQKWPKVTTGQQKSAGRPYEAKLYERPDSKLTKTSRQGASRALHEYQFLPEQPSVRNDSYERAVSSSHYYGSPTDVPSARTPLSTGRSVAHANEQVPSGYGFQGQQLPSLNLLPQQGRQGHALPSTSGDYDIVPRKNSFANTGVDVQVGAHPIAGLDNPFMPPDRQPTHDEEILRMEKKRKCAVFIDSVSLFSLIVEFYWYSLRALCIGVLTLVSEEARIAREVEAHEKRIRKELEKQDILRRKREEQMRKEMERQDRERRKEEERLLREKQREEERYQREQRREMERREKFLQKESIRAEKLRLKEEMRKEKEAARLKAANERATARRIAKEATELIDDERVELMDLATARLGLPSLLSLDSETLQNLESFRDMLTEFPPKSVRLKMPFAVWRFLITFADVLGLWPFTLDEFVQALHDYDSRLLGEIHVALLRSIIKDIEDVARTPSTVLGANQHSAANPGGGHPQIVEGAYAWGFDIRSWQYHLHPLTWPEILRQFALSAGFGPKLKKRNVEQSYLRDENEDKECSPYFKQILAVRVSLEPIDLLGINLAVAILKSTVGTDGEDVISNLRNGVAAENALAIMQERGFSNPRRSRHRLTPGTVKFAAFHVLSLEGSKGLTILDVAERIQKSGLRDLTTSKTPEASIAAALSRDTKLFERTAPSTYCVRAPYRKDPADAEAILSEAREKIQVFKNGYFEGDDVEREDVERDEDSESDVAEDLEVDDLGTELKPDKEALSCEGNTFQGKIGLGNGKETLQDGIDNMSSGLTSMDSEGLKEVKVTGASGGRSIDFVGVHNEVTNADQESSVIDESNCGEPWVHALTEGEYSDLSVEERLSALVALIGVANEGNSIRVVLEERLEAANALKKQIWAEAQVDKRRMKEEYVMKMQYSSSFVKPEHNLSISAVGGRKSPFAGDDKNDLPFGDPQNDIINNPNYMSIERNLPMQDISVGPDNNLSLQQAGYAAAEKSRSQLKAFIGHKAEEMYVYRSLPLGQDRRRNRYWQFITSSSRNDPGSGRIFVELRDGHWRLIDSEESFDAILASLDVRGVRESNLLSMLQKIEVSFKETVRKNRTVKTEISEMAPPNSNCSAASIIDSPNSTVCDMTESSSSFAIGLGRNEKEKNEASKRYQEFEKWIWDECFNASILCALKYGKTRCKQLLGVCDFCHDLYFNFDEHAAECKEKNGEADWTSHNVGSSLPPRIRLLKAQLAMIEVSVLVGALQPAWSDDFRETWAVKLHNASSAEDLLQILTMLESAVKRDFLSLNFETTIELLGSSNPKIANRSSVAETVSVLPWLPQTTSSVALRLMELDSSIFYTLEQKEESQKDKGGLDLMAIPTTHTVVKNVPDYQLAEAPHEPGYQHQDPWTDPGSGPTSSGRGRGRGRGRGGRPRGGRPQKQVIGSRSESGPRSTTTNNERLGQFVGWKGRVRGRGGRKRGRRTTRSRQKPVKRVTEIAGERENARVTTTFDTSSVQPDWNMEETTTPVRAESAENVSSSDRSEYDDDDTIGPPIGDEYDDLMAAGGSYSGVFGSNKPEYLMVGGGDYGDEDDDYVNDDEEDDVEGEDFEEDEQGNVDVEGYFNGDSDEEEMRDISGGVQIGNPDEVTESSSSEYSD